MFAKLVESELAKVSPPRASPRFRELAVGRHWVRPDVRRLNAIVEIVGIHQRPVGWAEVKSDKQGEWVAKLVLPDLSGPMPVATGAQMAVAFHLSAIADLCGQGRAFGYRHISERIDCDRSNYRKAVRCSPPPLPAQVLSWIEHWPKTGGRRFEWWWDLHSDY